MRGNVMVRQRLPENRVSGTRFVQAEPINLDIGKRFDFAGISATLEFANDRIDGGRFACAGDARDI